MPGRLREKTTTDCQEPYRGETGTGPLRLEAIPTALLLRKAWKANNKPRTSPWEAFC